MHEPPLPAIKDPWIRNEVDAFVLAKLRANGMNPNPPAAKEVLLRRVSYDVIGPMHIQLLANLSRAVIWLSKRGFARRSAFQHTVCSAVIFRLAPSATEARSAAGSVLR